MQICVWSLPCGEIASECRHTTKCYIHLPHCGIAYDPLSHVWVLRLLHSVWQHMILWVMSECYTCFILCGNIRSSHVCVLHQLHSVWQHMIESCLSATPASLCVAAYDRVMSECYPSFTLCGSIRLSHVCVLHQLHSVWWYMIVMSECYTCFTLCGSIRLSHVWVMARYNTRFTLCGSIWSLESCLSATPTSLCVAA